MTLKEELKVKLIEQLNLEELTPEDIADDAALFGAGLGLDSIDALEIIVLLDTHYGINVANPEEGKEIFQSVDTLASYIAKHQS
ncbi:acyl carrier protein [Reichenbachiella faecimaris]|uniref:Acyl carrier protein n=1 Tax=Reichenbachiella faecimaris TaxID=692418 RepID=A0A1W2G665_REIFA|nr:phosphopantetheine-binding protein [Reichenbachiella faecimaris]SMD32179.1 acyl carrier protein [Reichenbachiella faecimaris]